MNTLDGNCSLPTLSALVSSSLHLLIPAPPPPMSDKPVVRTIVCLANSRKQSGRCVAGKIHEQGVAPTWLRPVSSAPDQEISEVHRRYKNGQTAQLLDVVSIPITAPTPKTYQQENHLINDGYYWSTSGRANRALLTRLLDQDVEALWINGNNTFHGENDRIALKEANSLVSSLAFIWVEKMRLRSLAESAAFGNNKRKVRAFFQWRGIDYALVVTDPFIEAQVLAKPDGWHDLEDAFMCISLGVPHNGAVYKLVASIITPERMIS